MIIGKSTLNNYLMWRLAHNYLPYLSREFWEVLDIHKRDTLGEKKTCCSHSLWLDRIERVTVRPSYWFNRSLMILAGAKESVDRWEMCIVTTQKYFRLAMGSIYSKNNVALKDSRNGVSIFLSSVDSIDSCTFLLSNASATTMMAIKTNESCLSCIASIFLAGTPLSHSTRWLTWSSSSSNRWRSSTNRWRMAWLAACRVARCTAPVWGRELLKR